MKLVADENPSLGGSDPLFWADEPPKRNAGVAPAQTKHAMRRAVGPLPMRCTIKSCSLCGPTSMQPSRLPINSRTGDDFYSKILVVESRSDVGAFLMVAEASPRCDFPLNFLVLFLSSISLCFLVADPHGAHDADSAQNQMPELATLFSSPWLTKYARFPSTILTWQCRLLLDGVSRLPNVTKLMESFPCHSTALAFMCETLFSETSLPPCDHSYQQKGLTIRILLSKFFA